MAETTIQTEQIDGQNSWWIWQDVVDEDGNVSPQLRKKIAAGSEAQALQVYDEMFVNPVPQPEPERFPDTASAMREVIAYADRVTAGIRGDIPEDERASWTQKLAEAEAYFATPDAVIPPATPILSAEASITGETIAELASRVIAKGTEYKMIAGAIAGMRRSIEAQLDAVNTSDKREAILLAAQAQAEALLATRS